MDPFRQVRVFAKVVERGSLSRAAADLGVSQPTVSKAVAALETRLRAQLLLRTTRRVTVTDAGRAYYERCRALLQAWDEAEAEVIDQTTPRGTLRVHAPVVLGELYIGPLAVEFQRRHPAVRCEVTLLDAFIDVVAEGADLAVRLGAVQDASAVRRRLGTMRRILVAAPRYLSARGTPRSPEDLRRHDAVRYTGLASGNALRLGSTTVEVSPVFLANNAVVLRDALVAGLGVGLVTEWLVERELAAGKLVVVLRGHPPESVEVNVVFPSARFIPLRARRFVELLEARLLASSGMVAGIGASDSSSKR